MDTKNKQKLSVHRCRFVDFTPSAISALAFPPLPLPRLKKGRIDESESKQNAASSSSSSKRKFGTLAVGRANGNIELYEWTGLEHYVKSSQSWSLWKILYGPSPSKVDSLAFSIRHPYLLQTNEVPTLNNLRLFSAGGGSELVEWDLQRGTVLRTVSSQGGAIWSIAVNPASSVLALGCEDGCVRLLSIENDELSHLRKFDRAKCRLMSIAWGPPSPPRVNVKARTSEDAGSESDDDDDDAWSDEWLITGGSDSSVRKWDVKTGRVMDRMITDKLRKQATLVWSVAVLNDGTIVSGDSMGDVSFWDSVTCTQLSAFRAHGADVLCLAVSPDGESVFSSGVDQKTSVFSLVRLSSSDTYTRSRWVHSFSKRMHAHDVRALAMWPPHSPLLLSNHKPPPQLNPHIAPVLASGGLDMCVTLSPCASPSSVSKGSQSGDSKNVKVINPLASNAVPTFEDGVYRRVAYPTGLTPAINLARRADLVVTTKDNSVSIWRIQRKTSNEDVDYPTLKTANTHNESAYEKLLDMELYVTTNICASAISEDGRWLAVSDVYETKLFKLRDTNTTPRPKRVKSLPALLTKHLPRGSQFPAYHGCGASSLAFSPDGSKLIVAAAACGSVVVVELSEGEPESEGEVRVLRRFDQHRSRDAIFRGRVVKAMPRGRGQRDGQQVNGNVNGEENSSEGSEAGSDSENDDGASQPQSRSPSPAPFDLSSTAPDAPTPLITRLSISTDGQWLASADTHRRIHIFNLDSAAHHAALPSTPQMINAMTFWSVKPPSAGADINSNSAMDVDMPSSHASSPLLVLALANNTLSMYDVEGRRFPEWAQRICEAIPPTFKRLYDPVQGIMVDPGMGEKARKSSDEEDNDADAMNVDEDWNEGSGEDDTNTRKKPSSKPKASNRIFFWGSSWLCSANLSPMSSTSYTSTANNFYDPPPGLPGTVSKKRRFEIGKIQEHRTLQAMKNRDAQNNFGATFNLYALDNNSTRETNRYQATKPQPSFNIIARYRPMLFADFLGPNELVVVERPLVDLMSALPPAFFKPKYGT